MKTSDESTQYRSRASHAEAQIPRKPMIVTTFGVMPLRSTMRQAVSAALRLPGDSGSSSICVLMAVAPGAA